MNGTHFDDFDPVEAWADAQYKAGLPFSTMFARMRAGFRRAILIGLWSVVLLGGGVALSLFAGGSQSDYWSSIFLELASACVFFVVAPIGIRCGRKWPKATPLVLAALGVGLVIGAAYTNGKFQSVMIEFGVAIVMVAVLEIIVAPMLNSVRETYRAAKEEFERLEKDLEAAQL